MAALTHLVIFTISGSSPVPSQARLRPRRYLVGKERKWDGSGERCAAKNAKPAESFYKNVSEPEECLEASAPQTGKRPKVAVGARCAGTQGEQDHLEAEAAGGDGYGQLTRSRALRAVYSEGVRTSRHRNHERGLLKAPITSHWSEVWG